MIKTNKKKLGPESRLTEVLADSIDMEGDKQTCGTSGVNKIYYMEIKQSTMKKYCHILG